MLNISEAEKDLYRADGVSKVVEISIPNLSITLDNDDLVKESVSLTERIESEKNLSFKGCCASILSFEVANFTTDIRGQYIEATITAEDGETLPLFAGYVDSQSNTNYEDYITKITAVDALKPVLDQDVTSWYNALTFPITIKNMRDSFFTYVGMTQETTYLVNDGQTVIKSIDDPTITGATILKSICQISGRFGIYGRDKVFHYRRLGRVDEGTFPSSTTYPSVNLFPAESNANEQILKDLYSSVTYQPYHTQKVSKVIIIGQDGAIKGQSGDASADTLYIADNKLAWGLGNATQAAANIISEIGEISFTPARLDCKGLPYIECGDIFLANTRINAVTSYVLERTLTGIQAIRDSYVGDIEEKRQAYTLTVQTEIGATQSATSEAQSTADSAASAASTAQSTASGAASAASNAQGTANSALGTANNAITRIQAIESDYIKSNTVEAINGRINNLSSTVAIINSAYINEARCKTIVSNSLQSYFANITYLHVNGRISSSSGYTLGATTYTGKQANVRMADGSTRLLTYLGFT